MAISPVSWLSDAAYSALGAGERLIVWASTKVGVREQGRNAGGWVARFLAAVGLGVGYAWCASFIYWCAIQAGIDPALLPQKRKAASVAEWLSWGRATKRVFTDPRKIKRGDLMLYPHGVSHMGAVDEVVHEGNVTKIRTTEGNSNNAGSREGDGVYVKWRIVDAEMKFIDLSGLKVAA